MTDFLTRLAARQLGQMETIEPRIKAVYAPTNYGPEVRSIVEELLPKPALQPDERRGTIPRFRFAEANRESAHPLDSTSRRNGVPEPLVNTQTESPEFGAERVTRHTAPNPTAQTQVEIAPSNSARVSPVQPPQHIEPFSPPKSRSRQLTRPRDVARPIYVSSDTAQTKAPSRLVNPESRLSAPYSLPRKDRVDDLQQRVTEAPVHVTIGRIEVTAVKEAAPFKRIAAERKPRVPLNEYLARRDGRDR